MKSRKSNQRGADRPKNPEGDNQHYLLTLYVSGSTPKSIRAIRNIRKICEEHLQDRYQLEVVDLYQNPEAASKAQVVAAPTLIKGLPPPIRRLVGDLADTEQVLIGLGLKRVEPDEYGRSQ